MIKKILIAGFIGLSALLVGGCGDGLTDREESCLAATGNIDCKSEYERRVAQSNKDRMKYQMEQNRKKFNSSKPQVGYKPAAKPTMVKPGQPNPQVKHNTPVRKPVYQPKMKPFKPNYGGSSKKRK